MLTGADLLLALTSAAVAFLIGAALVWLFLSSKIASLSVRAENASALAQKCDALNAQVQELLQKNARLEQAEATQAQQFENLANRIFDAKKKESSENLQNLLAPLRERLMEFQKKVDDSFGAQAKEQLSLKREIEHIIAANTRMTEQTESLTRALRGDTKAQGNWGEVILEKILEESGLRKDHDYILQGSGLGLRHAEDSTRRVMPDAIINLPENKHIIVDAKVSLTHYERYIATGDDAALKDFLSSVRTHVKGLEERRYQDADKLGTPDFVLMFMPIEGAYSLAVQQDVALHSYAWDKKIVIVCPSTLFATLKTIASVWRLEMQNRNAEEIARQGGNLYDKVVAFVGDMQDLGRKIAAAQGTFDEAFKKLSTGKGNIIRRTEELRALGVKSAKAMPKELTDDSDDTRKIENA